MSTHTHTYAFLRVSKETYNEVRGLLAAAGYGDQFHDKNGQEIIDMHGIALKSEESMRACANGPSYHQCGNCGVFFEPGSLIGITKCPGCGAS